MSHQVLQTVHVMILKIVIAGKGVAESVNDFLFLNTAFHVIAFNEILHCTPCEFTFFPSAHEIVIRLKVKYANVVFEDSQQLIICHKTQSRSVFGLVDSDGVIRKMNVSDFQTQYGRQYG